MFRVLTLAIVVTMSLNSSCSNAMENKSSAGNSCDSVVRFFSGSKEVVLLKEEYSFNKHQSGYDLHILSDEKLQLIKKLKNASIEFCISSIKTIAKPNHILSSSVPENTNYFFLVNDDEFVFFGKDKIIYLRKIE